MRGADEYGDQNVCRASMDTARPDFAKSTLREQAESATKQMR